MMMMIMTGVPNPANCSPLLSPPESLVVHFLEGESSNKSKQKLSKSGPKDKISKNCIAQSSSVTYKSILRAW